MGSLGICPVVGSRLQPGFASEERSVDRRSRRGTILSAMKNLEEEQRKMRERMADLKPKRAAFKRIAKVGNVEFSQPPDLIALQNRIVDLEAENASLKLQVAKISDPPSRPPTSSDLSDSERRHLFMKYSNVRRY